LTNYELYGQHSPQGLAPDADLDRPD